MSAEPFSWVVSQFLSIGEKKLSRFSREAVEQPEWVGCTLRVQWGAGASQTSQTSALSTVTRFLLTDWPWWAMSQERDCLPRVSQGPRLLPS